MAFEYQLTPAGARALHAWASAYAVRRRPGTSEALTRLVEAYRKHWASVDRPRLARLRERAIEANDPVTARGDALDLIAADIETDFTKWLFWMVAPPEANREVQKCVLEALWPGWDSSSEFEVNREHQVAEGHLGQTGRLDLLIASERDRKVLAVEIKTQDPGEGELEKHRGYERSIAAAFKAWTTAFILLVPDPAVVPVDGTAFRAISWSAITMALRRLLVTNTLEPRDAALVALFVGAVEARVLGYPVRAWRRALGRTEPTSGLARAICASHYLDYLEETYGVENA